MSFTDQPPFSVLFGDDQGGFDGGFEDFALTPPGIFGVGVGDLNGDDYPDLVLGTDGGTVRVLLNTSGAEALVLEDELPFPPSRLAALPAH